MSDPLLAHAAAVVQESSHARELEGEEALGLEEDEPQLPFDVLESSGVATIVDDATFDLDHASILEGRDEKSEPTLGVRDDEGTISPGWEPAPVRDAGYDDAPFQENGFDKAKGNDSAWLDDDLLGARSFGTLEEDGGAEGPRVDPFVVPSTVDTPLPTNDEREPFEGSYAPEERLWAGIRGFTVDAEYIFQTHVAASPLSKQGAEVTWPTFANEAVSGTITAALDLQRWAAQGDELWLLAVHLKREQRNELWLCGRGHEAPGHPWGYVVAEVDFGDDESRVEKLTLGVVNQASAQQTKKPLVVLASSVAREHAPIAFRAIFAR
jgi:hypothetical protein